MSEPPPTSRISPPKSKESAWPTDLPLAPRLRVARRALALGIRERRSLKALFFLATSLLVGFTVAGWIGLMACGIFGGSMFAVVLVLRMERHLRAGFREYRAARESEEP